MNWFSRTTRPQTAPLETVIGPSANLRGTLQSDGGVRVEGVFEGLIETAGNVVVGPAARVVADITARNVTVAGAVKGNIDANGRLEILSSGAVYGDVQVEAVMIDEGGQFHGISRMRGLSHPALAAPVDMPMATNPPADDVDVALDDGPLEAKARSVPEFAPDSGWPSQRDTASARSTSRSEHAERVGATTAATQGTNGSDGVIDFDFEGIDLDIEPVIPDVELPAPSPSPARPRTRRKSAAR